VNDNDSRIGTPGMPVDAFMGDVQAFAIAREQFPESGGGKFRLRIRVAREVGQLGHGGKIPKTS
jgi:hypothetical protein